MAGKAHAVIGMRRAGKTTFLRQLLDERRAAGPAERAVYLSFDDDRLGGLELEQLGFLLEEYYRRHPALRGRDTVYWFLDEIQLVPGWERFVRRVLDTEKAEIAVSGSSARIEDTSTMRRTVGRQASSRFQVPRTFVSQKVTGSAGFTWAARCRTVSMRSSSSSHLT